MDGELGLCHAQDKKSVTGGKAILLIRVRPLGRHAFLLCPVGVVQFLQRHFGLG